MTMFDTRSAFAVEKVKENAWDCMKMVLTNVSKEQLELPGAGTPRYINNAYRCDEYYDCANRSDESGCPGVLTIRMASEGLAFLSLFALLFFLSLFVLCVWKGRRFFGRIVLWPQNIHNLVQLSVHLISICFVPCLLFSLVFKPTDFNCATFTISSIFCVGLITSNLFAQSVVYMWSQWKCRVRELEMKEKKQKKKAEWEAKQKEKKLQKADKDDDEENDKDVVKIQTDPEPEGADTSASVTPKKRVGSAEYVAPSFDGSSSTSFSDKRASSQFLSIEMSSARKIYFHSFLWSFSVTLLLLGAMLVAGGASADLREVHGREHYVCNVFDFFDPFTVTVHALLLSYYLFLMLPVLAASCYGYTSTKMIEDQPLYLSYMGFNMLPATVGGMALTSLSVIGNLGFVVGVALSILYFSYSMYLLQILPMFHSYDSHHEESLYDVVELETIDGRVDPLDQI